MVPVRAYSLNRVAILLPQPGSLAISAELLSLRGYAFRAAMALEYARTPIRSLLSVKMR